ncbi:hypothetical protein CB0940_05143 [Cercospora beticola]|uniref:Xylanolytic transcriptional activator regulatory domain-containing protein n=1 Tax=Cercospora beticola TaxID=122368 RepID=A0A2G5HKT9_CERBT|nr:hypothetical protein CB0940_05143 [Cercospora beticola]PIA93177.1 hypothetical protein CB0940_05143 [Cercospora beticola]WPB02451.1 hypothetical protein RHO25_007087 [Cercospora beticola]
MAQQCVYSHRALYRARSSHGADAGRRATKARTPARITRLESQVNGIYNLLQRQGTSTGPPNHSTRHDKSQRRPRNDTFIANADDGDGESSYQEGADAQDGRSFLNSMQAMILYSHLADVYRSFIHLQPLPLFDEDQLHGEITQQRGRTYLLHAFCALTLAFSDHELYRDKRSELVAGFAESARHMVLPLAAEGSSRLDVLRTLCLLALTEIKLQDPTRAWMTIGTAVQLHALQASIIPSMKIPSHDDLSEQAQSLSLKSASARVAWCVLLLQRCFFPNSPEQDYSAPKWIPGLPSHSYPHAILAAMGDTLDDVKREDKDIGINAYAWEWMAVSGRVIHWIHRLRQQLTATPSLRTSVLPAWAEGSSYTLLNNLLFETEARLHPRHLLRHTGPLTTWTSAELEQHRDYWRPWLIMQITSHAIPALLNHPFIHILLLRSNGGNDGRYHSRHFMQQVIDQALFHSGWVSRLIAMLRDSGLAICDPFIGHLVMAVATIPWFFQFAEDEKIVSRAVDDLSIAKGFLAGLAEQWPHVGRKLELFEELQCSAAVQTALPAESDGVRKGALVKFRSALIWELLDPTPMRRSFDNELDNRANADGWKSADHNVDDSSLPSATIHVTTRFTQPVEDDRPIGTGETRSSMSNEGGDEASVATVPATIPVTDESMNFVPFWDDALDQLSMNELFPSFLDMNWMNR